MNYTCNRCGEVVGDSVAEAREHANDAHAIYDDDRSSLSPIDLYLNVTCICDEPDIWRTLAKGTPAETAYCRCGGVVRDDV